MTTYVRGPFDHARVCVCVCSRVCEFILLLSLVVCCILLLLWLFWASAWLMLSLHRFRAHLLSVIWYRLDIHQQRQRLCVQSRFLFKIIWNLNRKLVRLHTNNSNSNSNHNNRARCVSLSFKMKIRFIKCDLYFGVIHIICM